MTVVWRRSSRCDSGHCVEVADGGATVLVRDSEDADGPVLGFDRDAWAAFVAVVKGGEFG